MAAIEPVRWGILSTARINNRLIPALQTSPHAQLVAVGSRTEARAKEYAEEHGVPRAHGSYEELVTDPELEAVYISTPNSLHVEWAVRALQAGKHVLCEKPFGRDPDAVAHAFDVADENGKLLMEGFMWRFHPQTTQLQLLAEELSPLQGIDAKFGFLADDPTDVRLSAELDGGALMDVGAYCISAARLLAGEPQRVCGRQVVGGDGVDVHFEATLTFENDLEADIECWFDQEFADELHVDGESGTLFLDDPWRGREPVIVVTTPLDRREVREPAIDPYLAEVENLSRAARGLEPPFLGREDAVGQARTIDALYRSAEAGGKPVELA
jgi:D-xylose 1-dehydrogenase (NADP+, D-xylono-1,5-lactone-forming)